MPSVSSYESPPQPLKYVQPLAAYEDIDKKIASSVQQPVAAAAIDADFDFGYVKAETLTPPDSPKDDALLELLKSFEPGELELVMSRVDNLESVPGPNSQKSFSDEYSSESGGSSPFAPSDTSGLDDREWTPPSSVRQRRRSSKSGDADAGPASKRGRAATSKPYAKPPVEERRQRKKEQNKNAATRYRLKKKAEVEEIRIEEQQLLEQNQKLQNQLEDISREVRCLKSLMRDVYRKKGLIK